MCRQPARTSSGRANHWEVCRRKNVGRASMYGHLTACGTIRKLWIGEAALYCAHLLRLDRESRRNRFGGTVADDYIRGYAQPKNLTDAVIHGFFVDGELRGVAELRPLPGHEAEV